MAFSLSIVIPSHNRPELLRACLHSVTRHAPTNSEILVVDDGSPSGRASSVAAEFPAVRCIRSRRKQGFCIAANRGSAATTGDIIELLNDDTEVTENWSEAPLRQFQDSSIGAVAPLVLRWAERTTIDSAGDRYFLGGIAGKRGIGRKLAPEYLQSRMVFGASGSSAFIRRAALEKVGTFPESFGAYFEDVDLSFRLHWGGYGVVFEPASTIFHHVSATYGHRSRQLLQMQSRNEELVFWRNVPSSLLRFALPRHALVLAGKMIRRWEEGTLAPFCCGRLRLLWEIPGLIDHRRELLKSNSNPATAAWSLEHRYFA